MGSSFQRASLASGANSDRMRTPKERAEAARLRILEAMERSSPRDSLFGGCIERYPISAVALVLVGGFVVGYSPRASRVLRNNIVGLLRFLADLRL